MEEKEDVKPLRISIGNGTYATKVKGKLVMVRNKKPETAFEISMDLLGEAFRGPLRSPKSKKGSPTFEDFQTSQFQQYPPNSFPMSRHAADGFEQPAMMDPSLSDTKSANLGPGPEVTMGPHGYGPHPRPRCGYGNRQLALMPIGGPQTMVSNQNPYPQSWMYPQGQISGFPSYGTGGNGNPLQSFATQWAANMPTAYNFSVTKHVCSHCGKLRSRKYHAENPIVAGELAVPAFCRKCQKDASSTDDESNGSEKDGRRSRKGKKGKGTDKGKGKEKDEKGNKKFKVDCDTGSSKDSLPSEEHIVFASWSGKERLQEDYVLIQDHEDNEPGRRHSTLRINIHDEPKDKRSLAPPSPLVQQVFDLRSSTSDLSNGPRRVPRERRSPSPRKVVITERNTTRRQSFVEPSSISRRLSPRENIRQVVTEEELEDFYRGRSRDRRVEFDECEGGERARVRRIDEEDREPCRIPARREYIIEECSTDAPSIRTGPKRYERGLEAPLPQVRSRLPHNIGPLKDDEIVVVTERYVYRPRRLESVREEDPDKSRHQEEIHNFSGQKQHHIDSITLGTDRLYHRFGAESEVSEYYSNDWNCERPHQQREKTSFQRVCRRDLVDDFRPRSQDPDNIFDVRRQVSADDSYLPRAPSPPAAGRRIVENHVENFAEPFTQAALYSLGDEGVTSKSRKSKSTERRRTRKSSYRSPYVQEGTEGGTEQALVPSPGHSRERRFASEDISEGTEEIERTDARRVKFREPETRDAWSAASATSVYDVNPNEWAPVGDNHRW